MMKTCPFRRYELGEPLIIKNVEISNEDAEYIKNAKPGIINLRDETNGASIELLHAVCNESDCAVWDAERNCCSFRSDPVKKEADHA